MNHHHLILLLFISTVFPNSLSSPNQIFDACSANLHCGDLGSNIGYPFYDGYNRSENCGYPGFQLYNCEATPLITIAGQNYSVSHIWPGNYTIRVHRNDNWSSHCPDLLNTTMDDSKFHFSSSDENITFFADCNGTGYDLSRLQLTANCALGRNELSRGYYLTEEMVDDGYAGLFEVCESNLFLPVVKSEKGPSNLGDLMAAFELGFEVGYAAENEACGECVDSGGACGQSPNNQFVCHCADADHDRRCLPAPPPPANAQNGGMSKKTIIILGATLSVALLALFVGGCLVLARRRRSQRVTQEKSRGIYPPQGSSSNGLGSSQVSTSTPSTNLSRSMPSTYGSFKLGTGGENTCYFGAHVFTYAELEHATCNFHDSRELGDGGFSTVYYGMLPDGRQVAVKRLYEHNAKRVEQFMNEIRILAELQHKNLVTLYGCTSKSDRVLLLVYEYLPNGTVADHIHGRLAESTFVAWLTRLNIAIQTAEALAFLHRNDVIHRDVKTANILLGNNFHVKVADFGLSRLFPLDTTHVSTAPQGTLGYVDPEYHQCYKLTEKSDVYSFGVVLAELISSKPAVDITRDRHHVNLANMALDHIHNQAIHELVDPRIGFDKDHSVHSMVKMVAELAFRCLQQDRDLRPTMDEVVKSLVAIQLEGTKTQKQDVVDMIHVYGDEVGLLTNPSPPLSPDLPTTSFR